MDICYIIIYILNVGFSKFNEVINQSVFNFHRNHNLTCANNKYIAIYIKNPLLLQIFELLHITKSV